MPGLPPGKEIRKVLVDTKTVRYWLRIAHRACPLRGQRKDETTASEPREALSPRPPWGRGEGGARQETTKNRTAGSERIQKRISEASAASILFNAIPYRLSKLLAEFGCRNCPDRRLAGDAQVEAYQFEHTNIPSKMRVPQQSTLRRGTEEA
ncbi:hypothetical protein SKAU_G00392510 [Synaphobranchus kaupii]|uniref:Uncharacterized protein n=1 Tax=Synaphobranchus kaupii TaxID=118154 RepID=A0A9Q1IDR6_SYNKA|nr:hypothetical protein SKAU_G00392510 [Synaphobranchus kaupii]